MYVIYNPSSHNMQEMFNYAIHNKKYYCRHRKVTINFINLKLEKYYIKIIIFILCFDIQFLIGYIISIFNALFAEFKKKYKY